MIRAKMLAFVCTAAALVFCLSCSRNTPGSSGFAANAFPPTLPNDEFHARSWSRKDCLVCHETGVKDATVVKHKGMPAHLLNAKCRTCHVPRGKEG